MLENILNKRLLKSGLALILTSLLIGCSKNYKLLDGNYIPEDNYLNNQQPMMFIHLENGEYAIIRHVTYDYVPTGKIERQGNKLILGNFFFEIIDDNKVVFKYVTDNLGVLWNDGTIFVFDDKALTGR